LQIKLPSQPVPAFALFKLGFRPFFLLAGMYALASILIWGGVYAYDWRMPRLPISAVQWHAHEMIFGYAMAVVAGFLLTAARNWTNIQTLRDTPLAGLALLWLTARTAGWMAPDHIWAMATPDLAFDALLIAGIAIPILRARKYDQLGIVSKLVLLMLANLTFYLGVSDMLEQGIAWGMYSGLYVMLALVFTLIRRVLPFFIERGVGYQVTLKNSTWIDRSSLLLLVLFMIADVFWRQATVAALLAALLFIVHCRRLVAWHTPGIWRKPLLWVLYAGYAGATLGFLLKALVPFSTISPTFPLHAFALGGIGMITLGMMARITLGHTGRNIQQHSALLAPAFLLLLAAYVTRVLVPIFDASYYSTWIAATQAAWITAFFLFAWVYTPMLIKSRADGMPG
jgi:uncharacterized protein involved in response to NO